MKQQMEAELIFDHPNGRDRAVAELTKRGFDVEILDWVDEYEGALLTPTVWSKSEAPLSSTKTSSSARWGTSPGSSTAT